jgi:hypothetical protein
MSTYPIYYAGQRLTAAALTAGQTNTVAKSANETVTSSIVLQNDDELVISGPVGMFRLEFDYFYTAVSGAAGGIYISLAVTGTITSGDMGVTGASDPAATGTDASNLATSRYRTFPFTGGNTLGFSGSSAQGAHALWIGPSILFSTAWSIQTQWCQRVSNATGTVMRVGSTMRATQIA